MLVFNWARGSRRTDYHAPTHAALVIGLLFVPAAGRAQQNHYACERGTWSEPVPVFPDSSGIFSPSLFFHDGQQFLLGNGLGAKYWTEMGLRLSRLDGRLLQAPEGDHLTFIMPVAGFDQYGRLNLFWAEPKADLEAPPRIGEPASLERVFHAVFLGEDNEMWGNGKRIVWSMPVPTFTDEEMIWRGAREAKAITAPDGTLHLAFPSLRHRVVHLRLRQSPDPAERRRQVTELFGDGGLYVDLAIGPDGEVYLPYIAGYPTRPFGADVNSVFFRRSADGGDTWERPVLVSRSGRAGAHFVRVAVTTSGQVHLVWLKNLSGSHILEVVWHSISDDGGRTWSEPQQIAAPQGNPYGLRVAADSSGALHVVFVSTNAKPHDALYYVRWDRGRWSTPCVVDPDFPVAFDAVPAIATDEDGRVHLVWNRGSKAENADHSKAVAVRSVLQSRPDGKTGRGGMEP